MVTHGTHSGPVWCLQISHLADSSIPVRTCLSPSTTQKLDHLFILLLQGSQANFWFSFPTNGITEARLKAASPLITVPRWPQVNFRSSVSTNDIARMRYQLRWR